MRERDRFMERKVKKNVNTEREQHFAENKKLRRDREKGLSRKKNAQKLN